VLHLVPRSSFDGAGAIGIGRLAPSRLDGDAELRDVGVREQAEPHQRRQTKGGEHEGQRREQRALRRGQRDAQRRTVDAMDHAHQSLQGPVALGAVTLGPQQAAREEGDDRQRNEQRRGYSEQHRRRQRTDEDAGALGQEQQRQEREQQRCGAADDGERDLVSGRDCSLDPVVPRTQVALDVLDDDDRVVDQQGRAPARNPQWRAG
jgi:hypothetical protein